MGKRARESNSATSSPASSRSCISSTQDESRSRPRINTTTTTANQTVVWPSRWLTLPCFAPSRAGCSALADSTRSAPCKLLRISEWPTAESESWLLARIEKPARVVAHPQPAAAPTRKFVCRRSNLGAARNCRPAGAFCAQLDSTTSSRQLSLDVTKPSHREAAWLWQTLHFQRLVLLPNDSLAQLNSARQKRKCP